MPIPFTDLFIEFTKEYESPTSFWRWGAYATIGAVLRDNIFWMQGTRKVCCNIYVLLLADSGGHRKSGPFEEIIPLLTEIKATKLIVGRSSIQAILDDLSATSTDKQTGMIIRGGSALLCAEELAAFFVNDPALIPILTDIYKYYKEWTSNLKSAKFKINNLCLSLLAASNESLLRDVYTTQASYGGLLARTFLVKPDEYRKGNALLNSNPVRYDSRPLVEALRAIRKVKGEVKFEQAAVIEYVKWYDNLREIYRSKPDRAGVAQRMHTGVLKIAVILAISSTLDLVVRQCDIEEAIIQCTSLLCNYEAYTMGVGKSTESSAAGIFLTALIENGGKITRKEFLFKHFADVNSEMLDKVVITLKDAGMIEEAYSGIGSNVTCNYVTTKKCEEAMRNGSSN